MNINDKVLYNRYADVLYDATIMKVYKNNRYRINYINSYNNIDNCIAYGHDLYISKEQYINTQIIKLNNEINILQGKIIKLNASRNQL